MQRISICLRLSRGTLWGRNLLPLLRLCVMPALVLRIPTKRGFTHPPTSTPQAGSDRSEDIFGVHVVCLSIMCVLVFDFEHVQLSGVEPHMTHSEFIRAANPHFFPPSVAVAVMFVFNDSVHDLWFR